MRYATYSLLIVFALLASCKEEKPPLKTFCELNPEGCSAVSEGKKFFAFKLGSWWLYEEETSGERDSVYVTQSSIDSDSYNFDIRMHSTLEGYDYHYWPNYAYGSSSCETTGLVLGKCLLIKRSKGKSGDFVGEGYCFFVNFKKYDYLGSFNINFENNLISVSEIHNSFNLNNFLFDKTIVIHELSNHLYGDQSTNHYFSHGVGLIRKELLYSNQIWNLIAYHIES